jgi:hypothetical protein
LLVLALLCLGRCIVDKGLNLLPLISSRNGMSVLLQHTNHSGGMGLCHPLIDGVVRLAIDFVKDPAGMVRVVCLDLNLHRSLHQAENVLRMDVCAGCNGDGEHRRREKGAMPRANFHQLVRCTVGAAVVRAGGCRQGYAGCQLPRVQRERDWGIFAGKKRAEGNLDKGSGVPIHFGTIPLKAFTPRGERC